MGTYSRKKSRAASRRRSQKSRKKSSAYKAPLPRNYSNGTRKRRVTLSWGIKRYLSKLKKAGY